MGLKTNIIALCLISSSVFATSAEEYARMDANNQAIKDCLLAYGYEGNTLTTKKDFNWQAASSCYAKWKQGVMSEEYMKLRFFLEENPWYKGGNWQWETQAKAGYECIKYHHTGAKICRKPYFRN
jgi:hypothetical protein